MTETSTQVLQSIIDTSGAWVAVVVGRDGAVIEAAGSLGEIDLDRFGAAVTLLRSGAESVGNELNLADFHTITLEVAKALIVCIRVGDALLVVLAPDSRVIHLRVKDHAPRLAPFY